MGMPRVSACTYKYGASRTFGRVMGGKKKKVFSPMEQFSLKRDEHACGNGGAKSNAEDCPEKQKQKSVNIDLGGEVAQ